MTSLNGRERALARYNSLPIYRTPPTFASSWWNFRTEQWDTLYGDPDDENAPDFLPQNPVARGTYMARRAAGDAVLEAITHVLTAELEQP